MCKGLKYSFIMELTKKDLIVGNEYMIHNQWDDTAYKLKFTSTGISKVLFEGDIKTRKGLKIYIPVEDVPEYVKPITSKR